MTAGTFGDGFPSFRFSKKLPSREEKKEGEEIKKINYINIQIIFSLIRY